MTMILAFQSLPMDLVNEIINMTPWEGQWELHKICMDQLKNMRKRLEDYQAGRRYCQCGNLLPPVRKRCVNYSYNRYVFSEIKRKKVYMRIHHPRQVNRPVYLYPSQTNRRPIGYTAQSSY